MSSSCDACGSGAAGVACSLAEAVFWSSGSLTAGGSDASSITGVSVEAIAVTVA